MPRAPQFIHPFRAVRAIMGMSQAAAGKALGLSASAIQQIERGLIPVSEDTASRMLGLSGAEIPLGYCRETIAPVAWDGSPYNANSLERWRKDLPNQLKRRRKLLFDDLQSAIKDAEREGCVIPFIWAVYASVFEIMNAFRLPFVIKIIDETEERERKASKSSGSKRRRRE
jgi:transcriptional regulator with XRE-family HTH domain